MKKIFALLLIAVLFSITMTSCEGWRTRYMGGSMTVNVPAGEVFVNSTWKDSNLWIICYNPTTKQYIMHETSNMGVFQGTVIINGGETLKDGVEILPQAPPPPPPAATIAELEPLLPPGPPLRVCMACPVNHICGRFKE